jgi:CDP-glycerol glycerophosphotransferase (TagB/SpsB family)
MVLSYYLFKYPYRLVWHLMRSLRRNPDTVVYCGDPLDYVVLAPVLKWLPPLPFVVKNRKTASFLRTKGIPPKRMPSFPGAVLMSRHAAYKFPVKSIVKIGFRHGAYHFKAFANTESYNSFDVFFVTSREEAARARARGIKTAMSVGFPKLDPAFDGTLDHEALEIYRRKAGISRDRQTVLFTATWDASGMSAIENWIEVIHTFGNDYNILVTVHPWTSSKFKKRLNHTPEIFFIDDPDVLPYMMISDLMVGDVSSIIAEFCALDKPIVTFRVEPSKRSVPEIHELLRSVSVQIDSTFQLEEAIAHALSYPEEKREERRRANRLLFDSLDGKAGKRAARAIQALIPRL